jgi:hypothetical protein
MSARTQMNRRIFLRGLGGAAVAAPFLASVAERSSKGEATTKPKQLIMMFTHNGCVTTKFFPVKSHGALAADDLTSTNLAALAPFAKKLLIPRGIRAMNEWTPNNNGSDGRGQGNDRYDMAAGSFFTLEPITPNNNDVWSFDQNSRFSPKPIGKSLDHVVAQQICSSGVPLVMRVGNSPTSGTNSNVSWTKADGLERNAAATIYPGLSTPTQLYSQLTGLFGTGPMNADTYEMIRGKKMCDVVKDDLAAFERQDMSAEDRNKVAVWKALCNDVGTVVTATCSMDTATRLGATPENFAAATMRVAGMDVLTNKVNAELDAADMYSAVAVLAAACNFNPVILLKYPLNHVFSGLGISVDSVSLSHRLDNAGLTGRCLPNALTMLQAIDRYHVAKFAKLIGMLDSIDNGDGSRLLDSTATVWFNQFSDGLAGNLNNLPIIQAGGCGGYFKTGWTVNVDPAAPGSPTLTRGNSEGQCAGVTADEQVNALAAVTTGTDPAVASGPINKYFYNLMNAVGVKADASGYPTKGGAAEVSKFGYSDRTTDFNGGYGAVAGATIHSPGEYTALKAGS